VRATNDTIAARAGPSRHDSSVAEDDRATARESRAVAQPVKRTGIAAA